MLASLLSVRAYLLIGVATALIVYLMTLVLGNDIAAWGREFRFDAALAGQRGFGRTLADPLIYVAENGILGAAIAGLLWPLLIIWALLTFVLLIIVISSGVAGETTGIITALLV